MEHLPFVTVIMPIRHEAEFIERSLGAVIDRDYPSEFLEVIIADGMSTDNTREIIRKLDRSTDISLKIVDNPQRIVPTGFNLALEQSQGEIIIRVDGHTIINRDYVRKCVDKLRETDADNVGGKMQATSRGFIGKVIAAATSSPFGVGGARFHYSDREEYVDTVYMGAWWKSIFIKIGNFDEELVRNQDDEFNYRLRSKNGKILLSPDIKSIYYNRSSLRSLFTQYYQYGLYKVRVMQKHPRQMKSRHFIPVLFVTAIVFSSILALLNPLAQHALLLILMSYIAASVLASIFTARTTKWRFLFFLPIVFFTLHFSYGLGFFHGLLKFRSQWSFAQ